MNLKIYSIKSRGGAFFPLFKQKRLAGNVSHYPCTSDCQLNSEEYNQKPQAFDEGPQRLSKLTHKLYFYSGEITKWWVVILPTGSSDCNGLDAWTINQSINKSVIQSYILKIEISFIPGPPAHQKAACSLPKFCTSALQLWGGGGFDWNTPLAHMVSLMSNGKLEKGIYLFI